MTHLKINETVLNEKLEEMYIKYKLNLED